jgi:acyl-ACP thioesterase
MEDTKRALVNPWKEPREVRFTQTAPDGSLSLPALADYLQEAASSHAEHLGFSLADMQKRGVTWVMLKLRVEIDAWPRIHDRVTVETWPSSLDRLYAHRDFRILDAGGREIVRATTAWVLIDFEKRTPVRINTFMSELYAGLYGDAEAPRSMEHTHAKLALPAEGAHTRPAVVRRADIDMNGHANNAAYVSMLSEALPEAAVDGLTLREYAVEFKDETYLHEALESRAAVGEEPEGKTVALGLVRPADGKPVALGRMKWR